MVALRTGNPVPNVLMQVYNPREARYRLINIQAVPLFRPEEAKPYGVYAVFDDVTERKQAEEALRESEQRLRTVLENSRDGINMLDLATGRYVFMSPAQVELTGFTADELNELTAEEACERVHPDDREISIAQQQRVAAGEDSDEPVEYRWKVKSGQYRWFSDRRKLVRNERGHPVALVGVSRDITERKLAEEEHARLLEAASALTKSVALPDVLDTLARITLDAGGHSRVAISLWQEELGCLTVACSRGEAALATGLLIALDDLSTPARRASENHETVLIDYDAMGSARRGVAAKVTSHLALDVPLFFGERFLGLLATDDPGERREFSDREIRLVEGIAVHAAVAIENARLFEHEQQAAKLNTALAAVDRAIHSSLDFAEVMQTALREGAAVIGAETAGISMHEDEAQRFRVAYIHNYPPDKLGILIPDADDTHGVEAMRTGKTLAISDTHSDPRVVTELMDAWNIKSVICAPLVVRGRPIAVAYFSYHTAAHRFSEQEIEFVTKLASSLSGALENAQLYEREAEAASLAQVLNEMNGLINSTLDAQEIMQTVVEQAVAAVGADSAIVALRHGDDWVAEYGYPEVPGVIHESMRTDEAPFMVAAVTRAPADRHRRLRERLPLPPRGSAPLRRALRALHAA